MEYPSQESSLLTKPNGSAARLKPKKKGKKKTKGGIDPKGYIALDYLCYTSTNSHQRAKGSTPLNSVTWYHVK